MRHIFQFEMQRGIFLDLQKKNDSTNRRNKGRLGQKKGMKIKEGRGDFSALCLVPTRAKVVFS